MTFALVLACFPVMASFLSFNVLSYCLCAIFWSGSFIAIKILVAEYSPIWGATLRVLVASLALTVYFRAVRVELRVPRSLRARMWGTGILAQGLPFAVLFYGEQRITPGLAGVLNGSIPLWTFLFGAWWLRGRDRLGWLPFVGALCSLVGLAIVFAPYLRFTGARSETIGALLVCAMAMSYGMGSVCNRWLLLQPGVSLFPSLYHQHVGSLTFLVVASLALGGWPPAFPSMKVTLAVLYLGLFSTALAWVLIYRLMQQWGLMRASSVNYVVPLLTLVFDFVLFHRAPTPSEILGAAGILSGVFLIQAAPWLSQRWGAWRRVPLASPQSHSASL